MIVQPVLYQNVLPTTFPRLPCTVDLLWYCTISGRFFSLMKTVYIIFVSVVLHDIFRSLINQSKNKTCTGSLHKATVFSFVSYHSFSFIFSARRVLHHFASRCWIGFISRLAQVRSSLFHGAKAGKHFQSESKCCDSSHRACAECRLWSRVSFLIVYRWMCNVELFLLPFDML